MMRWNVMYHVYTPVSSKQAILTSMGLTTREDEYCLYRGNAAWDAKGEWMTDVDVMLMLMLIACLHVMRERGYGVLLIFVTSSHAQIKSSPTNISPSNV